MTKTELIGVIAVEAGITKAAAAQVIDAVTRTIVKTVAAGEDVSLIGFGSFKATKRAARTGRNPKTGAVMKIAESLSPKFTPGATFKQAVAKK